ncbi:MAG: prepilin-type N-terminal cleavage/methylation domain-containing protein [Patescibacteria group bacterium]
MHKGFTLVEALVALAVIVTAALTVYGGVALSHRATVRGGERAQAAFLLEEGYEALLYLRDVHFADRLGGLTANGSQIYCLNDISAGGSIGLMAVPTVDLCTPFDGFTRSVTFKNACRDNTSHNIMGQTTTVSCPVGQNLDTDTKYALIKVTWGTKSEQVEAYIANLFLR